MKTRELKFLGILAVLFLMGCGEEAVTPGQVVGGDGEAYAAIAQGQPGSASGTTPAEQTGFGTGTAGESSEEGSGDSTPSMG